MPMDNPPHPGEHLREDWIKPLGLSVTKAATVLGVARKTVDAIAQGRAGVSADGTAAKSLSKKHRFRNTSSPKPCSFAAN